MNIQSIESEADYEAALAEIDRLMDAVPDTPQGVRLDESVTLVEAYEARVYPMEDPSRGGLRPPPSPRGEGS